MQWSACVLDSHNLHTSLGKWSLFSSPFLSCQFNNPTMSEKVFHRQNIFWLFLNFVRFGKWFFTCNKFLLKKFFFCFFRATPWHMEVPRLGVELELQLPAYGTAIAMQYLSCVCDLHHSSWQYRFLNPLSEARDCTHILMDPSWVC